MKHTEWLIAVTSDSVRNVAITIGLPPRTLATQLEKQRLSPENIIKIAEHYDTHPVGALVDTGYLDPRWANQVDPESAVRLLTDEQVTNEVLRRLTEVRGEHPEFHTPVDELAERRANVGPEFYAVADSSPDEDAMRAEEEGDAD